MNPNDPQQPGQPQQPPAQPPYQPYPQPQAYQPPVTPPAQPQAPPSTPQYFQPTPPAAFDARQAEADFSFITNPEKKPARAGLLSGGSTLQRVVFATGGLTLLVVLIAVGYSLINGGGPNTLEQMTAVAQRQTELNRVASLGATGATTAAMRGAATSVQLSSLSARSQVTTYLATNGEKLNPKLLALKRNTTVDTALKSATANNTYNDTFTEVINNDLESYMAALKTAYNAKPGPKGEKLLKTQYANAELLAKQIKAAGEL